MPLESTTLGQFPSTQDRAGSVFVRYTRWCLASLLILATVACSSEDKNTADDDDSNSSESATGDDDDGSDGDDDSSGDSKKDSGASGSKDSGMMRTDAGRMDSGMSGSTDRPDASRADAGTKADSSAGPSAGGPCTRENLKQVTEQYYEALAANDSSTLPLASDVKYTEKGAIVEVGEGLWQTAGELKFKHSLFDAVTCNSVTQSVIAEGSTDIPLGLRLKLEDGKITEIEAIPVRAGDYFVGSNTRNMIATGMENWESIVPEEGRWTREQHEAWMNKYFKLFGSGGCNFSDDCRRMENGFELDCTAAVSCSDREPGATGTMNPRLIVVDEEAGLSAAFVIFIGGYTDFHMIKVVNDEVLGVYTILASGEGGKSGWE